MSLSTARAALAAAGYDGSSTSDDRQIVIAIEDDGEGSGDEGLSAIRAIVEPEGCTAEWTGDGDTWGDGSNTSDVRVEEIAERD